MNCQTVATVDHIPGIQEEFISKIQEPNAISESAAASRADLPVKMNGQPNAKGFPKRNAEEDLNCSSKRPRPVVVIGGPPEFKASIGSIGKGPATAKSPPQQECKKLPEGAGNVFQTSQSQTGLNVTNLSETSARLPSYKPKTNDSPIVSTGFVSVNKPHGNTTQSSVGIGRSLATAVNSIPVVHRPTSSRTRGGQPQRVRSFVSPRARRAFEHKRPGYLTFVAVSMVNMDVGIVTATTSTLAVFVGGTSHSAYYH
jgi:hypothetical protein